MDDAPIIHAFKHMQVPLMIVGPVGQILHCNAATERLFGYEPGGLMGQPVFDILPVASVAELNAFIEPPAIDAIVKGMTGRKRNGDPVALAVQITAWTDRGHGFQHALSLRDISAELEAERASRDELTRANSAIQGARIGVFEYNPHAETVIVSHIWRDLLELGPADPVDVQLEWRGRVHPDDLDAALEPVRLCLEEHSERAHCEYRLRSKNGTLWRWMRTDIAVSRRDGAGKVIRLIGAMTDITAMKEVEEALRLRNLQFQSIFENAPIGKAIVALDGRWQWVNPAICSLLGYSEEELLRTDSQSLTHPDDIEADIRLNHRLLDGSTSSDRIEKRYIRSDGEIVWGLLSRAIVRDEQGKPLHFITQIVNVTEQHRLAAMKSEFVSTVSHELRTPLTSILASLELLDSLVAENSGSEARRLVSIARQNGKHLNNLVRNILDFERFSTGRQKMAISEECVADLLEQAVLANSAYAEKLGVRLVLEHVDRRVTCDVDADRFQQIMANLLSNAAKFSAQGEPIKIRTGRDADHIQISVANEGSYIPPGLGSRIFQPFTLASPSSTRGRGGAGLGLSICKQLVDQMGGEIGFVSEAGKTTFWFTVPVGGSMSALTDGELQSQDVGVQF